MKIQARERDLGGFTVRRVLPYAKRRMVGPFIFLDHMGPMELDATHAMDVRPHPHIGLATFTYLYEGIGFHRDSIGSQQELLPGEVNWMIAGSGIAHSERSPKTERTPGHHLHGIQIWVALPTSHEEVPPEFHHHSKSDLPEIVSGNSVMRVLLGEHAGKASKVKTLMRALAIDLKISAGDTVQLPIAEKEFGIYVSQGAMKVNGEAVPAGTMLIIDSAQDISVSAEQNSRAMLVGGDPYPEDRYIWWNFVSSQKERIHKAAKLWQENGFAQVPDETERTPLPNDPLP